MTGTSGGGDDRDTGVQDRYRVLPPSSITRGSWTVLP